MNHYLVSDTGSQRLILIFAGWGMDDHIFTGLSRSGYDIMVVWDYTSLHIDWECVTRYTEVCVLAWSLGVYASSLTTHAIDYKITRRVAVNGTLTPCDDRLGIPTDIFRGTLEGLCDASVTKFRRRMCATRDDYARFSAVPPARSTGSLRAELQAIEDSMILHVPSSGRWDKAVIGRADRIFPPHNQRRAWTAAGVQVEITDNGHFPDFSAIIESNFIDKSSMTRHFADGMDTYAANAGVQREVVDIMLEMSRTAGILRHLRDVPCEVLEIGSGAGTLSRPLAEAAGRGQLTLWDVAAPRPEGIPDGVHFECCDAEMQIGCVTPGSYDLIFSASTMQWFNSPDRFLDNCARALRPEGIAVLSTYTTGNMHQIAALTHSDLPLLRPAELIGMASKRFDIIDSRAWERDLDFESPLDVLRHMRLTGVNSLGGGNATARALTVARRYPMMLDGRYHLTYRPMIIILRKK